MKKFNLSHVFLRNFTPTQQRWSATKRELYGLMWAMEKLRYYSAWTEIYCKSRSSTTYLHDEEQNEYYDGRLD